MIRDLHFLVLDVWRTFSWRGPLLILLMVASGLLEGLAVTAALPLLSGLGSHTSSGGFVVWLAGIPRMLGLPPGPAGVGTLMTGLILLSSLTFLGQARLSAHLQMHYVARWQKRLFNAMLRAEPTFVGERRGGDVVNALVNEAVRLSGAFYHTCLGLAAIFNLLIYLILAVLVSAPITLAVLIFGVLLLVATRPFIARAYRFGVRITEASAEVQSLASEGVSAAKLIKACAAEDEVEKRFAETTQRLANLNFRNAFDVQTSKAVFEFGGAAGIAALLIAGPIYFTADVATILVVLALFVRLLPRITSLQQSAQAMSSLLPAIAVIRDMVAQADRLAEPHDDKPLPDALLAQAPAIQLQGVTVRRGGRIVLDNVDLEVPSGHIVAFVGPSGSGKSTLVDAILGLVPLAAGRISISGFDLKNLPLRAWRKAAGYVSQDAALLAGTIARNISLGNEVTEEHIDEALQRASADFVATFHAGSQTLVGDRGARLSGGERQRLGFARALAAPRLLYVLDEATSALDSETEARILATTSAFRGQATVIVIAHRFAAVRMADIIYVVDGGRVVERGEWEHLDRAGTRFYALKSLQDLSAEA